MFIGSLSGFTAKFKHDKFSAPFSAIFTHLSEFRLQFGVLLSVCATFKLDIYDFIVLLFKFFLQAAHVTKALANSTGIGSLKDT